MILFENVPSQFFQEPVFLYEQPFGGNLVVVLKVKLKKSPYTYPIFEDHVTRPPPLKKTVLTKRSSLWKSSNSGSQVGKDVMTAAVWSQFFTLTISACGKRFLFLTINHFDWWLCIP